MPLRDSTACSTPSEGSFWSDDDCCCCCCLWGCCRLGVCEGDASLVVALIWSMALLSLSSCRRGQRWMPCLRQARCTRTHRLTIVIASVQLSRFSELDAVSPAGTLRTHSAAEDGGTDAQASSSLLEAHQAASRRRSDGAV